MQIVEARLIRVDLGSGNHVPPPRIVFNALDTNAPSGKKQGERQSDTTQSNHGS
jgi:hypothetical protein